MLNEMPQYKIKFGEKKNEIVNFGFDYLPEITNDLDCLDGGRLLQEDILKITLWKINRYPEEISEIAELVNSVKDNGSELVNIMPKLLKMKGVGLPMASAYLRFCNPKKYQIIDTRAFRAAFDFNPETFDSKHKSFPDLRTARYEVYDSYLRQLEHIATNGYHGLCVDFEDLDRFLYDVDKAFGHKIDDKTPSQDWENLTNKPKNEQAEIIIEKIHKLKNK